MQYLEFGQAPKAAEKGYVLSRTFRGTKSQVEAKFASRDVIIVEGGQYDKNVCEYGVYVKMTDAQRLMNAGAERARAEDRYGDTKTGWWQDGVFLGTDARTAAEGLFGG